MSENLNVDDVKFEKYIRRDIVEKKNTGRIRYDIEGQFFVRP